MEPQQGERRHAVTLQPKPAAGALPAADLLRYATKTYRGTRNEDGSCAVYVDGIASADSALGTPKQSRQLPLHLGVRNQSPTGFAWGYNGSGPVQLALALLIDATGDVDLALQHCQDFKCRYVGGWGASWSISQAEICEFITA